MPANMFDLASWLAPIAAAPIAGSFVGVLIRRLPQGRPVGWARSECDSCKRSLSFTDLIPIASYVTLRGRCAACYAPIGPFHLVIELAAVAVAVSAALIHRDFAWLSTACLLGWTLLALAWIDAEHMRLPDALTLPLVAAGLTTKALLAPEQLAESVLGAVIGYLSFRAVAVIYRVLRKRDGLGGGDAKLLSAVGAWVGWAALPDVVLLAAVCGLGLVAIKQATVTAAGGRTAIIPFGPCLALASWTIYLFGSFVFDGLR